MFEKSGHYETVKWCNYTCGTDQQNIVCQCENPDLINLHYIHNPRNMDEMCKIAVPGKTCNLKMINQEQMEKISVLKSLQTQGLFA